MSMDEDDSDIELEGVSQVHRCNICLRCYLSYNRLVEHYPEYHPEEMEAFTAEAVIKEEPEDESSTDSVVASHNEPDDGSLRTLYNAFNSNDANSPKRPKISLRQNRLNLSVDDSCTSSSRDTSIDQREIRATAYSTRFLSDFSGSSSSDDEDEGSISPGKALGFKDQFLRNKEADNKANDHLQVATSIQPNTNNVEDESNDDSLTSEDEVLQQKIISTVEAPQASQRIEEIVCDQEVAVTSPVREEGIDKIKKGNSRKKNQKKKPKVQKTGSIPPPLIQKKFLCQYCNRLFTRDRTLQSHVKSMHLTELENIDEKPCQSKGNRNIENGNENNILQDSEKAQCSSDVSSTGAPKTGKGSVRKKRKIETPVVNEEALANCDKDSSVLSFSCKWCTEKFIELDLLKRHAINVHIKYKTLE